MKNFVLVFCILACLFCNSISAQNDSEKIETKNEIGIELTGILDGQYQVFYERSLNEHWSVGLGVGGKTESGLVNVSGIDSPSIKTGDINYSGFKVIGEGRYYLSGPERGNMTGFYFGAYAKHSNFKSDIGGTYIDDNSVVFEVDLTSDFSITSVGFMVGYKLPVWKQFNIDFLIAGPGAGLFNFEITNNKTLPDSFFVDLNEALENFNLFDYVGEDFDFGVNDSKASFTAPSFRYAIKVNYAF